MKDRPEDKKMPMVLTLCLEQSNLLKVIAMKWKMVVLNF